MAANTAVVIVGSDSEGEESSTRKKRRQTTSSSSEVVDLTLASAHAAARGRQRNVGGDVGNASSSVSTVVEIQAGKRGTQKEVVFVLSDESDPEYSQTNGQTTSTTTINTKTDAQVALELQIQEWAPAKKTEKKKFKQKRGKGAVKVSSSAAKASSSAVNVKSPSSNVPSNYLAPSSQDVTFLAQNGASVHRSGTSFQFPPYQPPFQSPFLQPSSFQQPSYVPPSTSNSNYLTPASSIQPPTPSSYFPPASSNLPTRVDNYSAPQLSTTACLPSEWSPCSDCQQQKLPYQLIELPMDTSETQQIISDFIKGKFRTVRISRIQNPTLWRRYETEKTNILAERGKDYNLNERLFYHTSNAPTATICTEGLDMRLSRAGHFGKGIYFSDLPSKCHCYCHQRHQRGVCEMYACKVILGEVKTYSPGHSDPTLVREPPKEPSVQREGFPAYYDSVLGFIQLGNEYIIYNNYRALPLYVVEYRKW